MTKTIKRILVSQPAPSIANSPYKQMSKSLGVEFFFRPLFQIEPISLRALRDTKIDITQFDAIIFTSKTLIDHYFKLLDELRLEYPDGMRYFCSNATLVAYLQKYVTIRKRRLFVPEGLNNKEKLIDLIKDNPTNKYFLPIVGEKLDPIFEEIQKLNIDCTILPISIVQYQTFTPEELDSYNMILFFSHNGVESLFHNYPDYKQGDTIIGCMGASTKKALEEANLEVTIMAPTKEHTSITSALNAYLLNKEA